MSVSSVVLFRCGQTIRPQHCVRVNNAQWGRAVCVPFHIIGVAFSGVSWLQYTIFDYLLL